MCSVLALELCEQGKRVSSASVLQKFQRKRRYICLDNKFFGDLNKI